MIAVCHSTNSLKLHRKNKECAKHILAPVAAACDIFIIRRSAHPAGGFLYNRKLSFLLYKKSPLHSLLITSVTIHKSQGRRKSVLPLPFTASLATDSLCG